MRVRDVPIGAHFKIAGGNRVYVNDDPTPYIENDILVRCWLTSVPYVIDLDIEVELCTQ